MTSNLKLAVLIDADNAQASIVKELLGEVSTFGTASVKRAYGDWTTPNAKTENSPAFDPRNYGCEKLGELVRRLDFVDVKEVHSDKSPNVHLYVRLK